MSKTPFKSRVQLDGLTTFLLYAPDALRARFLARVDTIVVERGWQRSSAERLAWREWCAGADWVRGAG